MPLLDFEPGQSPEAPGVLMFYEQGATPATGFQVTSKGVITTPGGQSIGGDLAVTGDVTVGDDLTVTDDLNVGDALTVTGFTALNSAQTAGNLTAFGADGFIAGTAGGGLNIKEGANARMGTATLVAGTVLVATTEVTANSRIFLTAQTSGAAPGALRVSARVAATSFTITSTSGTDTSSVAWMIVEPAA